MHPLVKKTLSNYKVFFCFYFLKTIYNSFYFIDCFMHSFSSRFNFNSLKENFLRITARFPFSVFALFCISWLLLSLVHRELSDIQMARTVKQIWSLIIFFFLSTGLKVFSEACYLKKTPAFYLQIFAAIFTVLFYFGFHQYLDDIQNIIYFILNLVWIISLLFFAWHSEQVLTKKTENNIFYSYFYNISLVFLLSIVLAWILIILGFIGISAVLALFDLHNHINEEKIFFDWIILTSAFLVPLFWISHIPEEKTFTKDTFKETMFFRFLVKYIGIAFIYIYFFILYAYSLKVLLNFSQWPQWEVSWLVIGFSTFGYLIYIFSYIFSGKNNLIKTFRKIFPYAVLPQLAMLFYAICLRIEQYDITMNRYFVVIFGLWLLCISLYYIFSKKKYLYIIPLSLTIITTLISIWPWSVYNLPQSRQLDRLIINLEQSWILKNNTIIPLQSDNDIDQKLSKEIYWGIKYLCQFNNCKNIKALFPDIYTSFLAREKEAFIQRQQADIEYHKGDEAYIKKIQEAVFQEPKSWEITQEITRVLHVKNYFETGRDQEYIFISLDYSQSFFPIDTTWYSQIYEIRGDREIENIAFFDIINAHIDLPGGIRYDTQSIIEKLTALYNTPWLENPLKDPSLLQFETENYKIYIRNVNLINPQYTWEKSIEPYYSAQWYILIK